MLWLALVTLATIARLSGQDVHVASELADAIRPAFAPELAEIRAEHVVPGFDRLVVLIGENHASVKTQKQLVSLLERVLDAHAADSILIEGSDGPVEVGQLIQDALATGVSSEHLKAYWQDRLDSGLISGCDFVTLTRPAVTIVGVEDLAAKARYAELLIDRELSQDVDSNERALILLQKALDAVRKVGDRAEIASVELEVAVLQDSILQLKRTSGEFTTKHALSRPLQVEYVALQAQGSAIWKRLEGANPSIKDYNIWVKRHNSLVDQIGNLRKALSALGSSLSRDGAIPRSSPSIREMQIETKLLLNSLERDEILNKIRNFESLHKEDLATLPGIRDRVHGLSDKLAKGDKDLASAREACRHAEASAEDAFFIAANHLQDLADEYGIPVPGLMSFYRDERVRVRDSDLARADQDLDERDAAMVENTMRQLQAPEHRCVLLVVGYAHLADLESKFAARGTSCVSTQLTASKGPTEPWEVAAWNRRQLAVEAVFSKKEMREVTPLLDESWKAEQVAKLNFFTQLYKSSSGATPSFGGLAWDGRVYEDVPVGGKPRTLHVGRFPLDPNAEYGTYMIDRGPVPGKVEEFYEVIDRQLAVEDVKKRSDTSTSFVFFCRTQSAEGGGKPLYRFESSAGQQSFENFISQPPKIGSDIPKRVVLFGEADEVMQGDLAVSPLWERLRTVESGPAKVKSEAELAAGGAGNKPPIIGNRVPGGTGENPGNGGGGSHGGGDQPPGNGWTSAFWDPDKGGRPQLLRTINPGRAKRNLMALDKQQEAHLGHVKFFDEGDLNSLSEKLRFTPGRGDNAQMVLLIGRNVPELRAAVRAAGEARLLKGKQVVLIMCGDSFRETVALRENLLHHGALMVWTNDRQITPEAGTRLRDYVRDVAQESSPGERKTIDQLMNRALYRWYQEAPDNPDLRSFERAATYVFGDSAKPTKNNPSNVSVFTPDLSRVEPPQDSPERQWWHAPRLNGSEVGCKLGEVGRRLRWREWQGTMFPVVPCRALSEACSRDVFLMIPLAVESDRVKIG